MGFISKSREFDLGIYNIYIQMTEKENDPNYERNPYTKRLVKKCGEREERIPREDGDFKTFKCYKRCNANQKRNVQTMRCRKQKPSASKSRSSTVEYNVYPSPSSVHGSNDLRKKKSRSSTVEYNVYPSPSSVHGSNDLRKTSSVHKSNPLSNKTRKKLKLDAIRNRKTFQKGREWFWEHGKKTRK